MVKAVILSGGEGKRLRAVTGEHPKPLVPLLGRSVMEHILILLRDQGFTEICAAVKYHAEEIMARFGDGHDLGVKLEYRVEKEALGTAGAVKHCASFAGNEDLLVISGDAACDFDLRALFSRHRERGAAATLALYRQETPLRFGLAVTEPDGRIRSFIEKPSWSRVVTDLVNTGIYVLSPRALAAVPEDRPYDFARDLFPSLLAKGELLLGVPMEGYWRDIGTPLAYYRCCVDALEGKLQLAASPDFLPAAEGESEPEVESAVASLVFPCRSRAELMAALSRAMLEMDADYTDGIRLHGQSYELHISPLSAHSALRIAVDSPDAEFARRLAFSARDLAAALET